VAIRDIHPGEQLTDDYGTLNIDEPFDCFPEDGTDRIRVYPDDLLRYHEEWDAKVIDALQHFYEVKQPLQPLIRPEFVEKVSIATTKHNLLDSIKCLYYNRHHH
jgi:hypothetical protein